MPSSARLFLRKLGAAALLAFSLAGCGGDGDVKSQPIPAAAQQYVVFAWNDLGMHCLNPTYDTAVILPPYNTVWAQVVQRGNPPKIITTGLTVEYRIIGNTTSVTKKNSMTGQDFSQFWTFAPVLFGVTLQPDEGLNLETPTLHNKLAGTMVAKGDHFQVNGIPVVPINDSGIWNPYQVAEITVKDSSTGIVLATTRATVPTSDEINCGKCHAVGGTVTQIFSDILAKHDSRHGTTLQTQKPVLCAKCHGSPALGTTGPGSSGLYLSQAIHNSHASRSAACYDCHPGQTTQCNRSLRHTASDGNCANASCHGNMAKIASDIASGAKVPWVNEPKCTSCHAGIAGVDTGTTLYRNAAGHGGVYCAGCHGSPHAMYPVSDSSLDKTGNYQALQYQSVAKSIGSCGVCHGNSRGEGAGEFAEQHNNSSSACGVCHTGFQNLNTSRWPHAFQWRDR